MNYILTDVSKVLNGKLLDACTWQVFRCCVPKPWFWLFPFVSTFFFHGETLYFWRWINLFTKTDSCCSFIWLKFHFRLQPHWPITKWEVLKLKNTAHYLFCCRLVFSVAHGERVAAFVICAVVTGPSTSKRTWNMKRKTSDKDIFPPEIVGILLKLKRDKSKCIHSHIWASLWMFECTSKGMDKHHELWAWCERISPQSSGRMRDIFMEIDVKSMHS